MKPAYVVAIPTLLMLVGCEPNGHGVRQTMFTRDVILHLPHTSFKETNRRSIRVLPHTWVTIKRMSVVLTDGTIVPSRDFQEKSVDLVRDDDTAHLLATVTTPSPEIKELIIDIDRTGQCTPADGASLTPCELSATASNDASKSDTDILTLHCPISQRDSDSKCLVITPTAERTAALPSKSVPFSIKASRILPPDVETIQSPWMNLSSDTNFVKQTLSFGLSSERSLPSGPILVKGSIQPDTRIFTSSVVFDQQTSDRVVFSGTVIRLDIAKRTFQLRVDDASDGRPYATLYFRLMDDTKYTFAGALPPLPATFDDISLGRRIWVQTGRPSNPENRLDANAVQVLGIGVMQPD